MSVGINEAFLPGRHLLGWCLALLKPEKNGLKDNIHVLTKETQV